MTDVEICCLCLKLYSYLEGIYEKDENLVRHYEKLKLLVSSEIWYKDYRICKNCAENLDHSHKFITMCINNESKRKEVYKKIKGPFSCNDCNKTYKSEICLRKHVRVVHLHVSGNKNKKNEELTINISNPDPDKMETNAVVVLVQNEESSILLEQGNNESNSSWGNGDVRHEGGIKETINGCSNQDKNIKQRLKIKRHKTVVPIGMVNSDIGQWNCDKCGIQFKQEKYLKRHNWSKHIFQRTFKCDQCDSTYKYRNSLEIHKRVHTGERPFVCSFCGKDFRSGQELNVHVKLHMPEKNYCCPFCAKAFKTAGNLRKHKICVHTNSEEYKYICSQCGHKFPFKGHLDLHLKRHAGIKKLPCHICGKKFLLKSDVDFHVRRTHRNEQLANCEVCEKQFKTSHGLKKHMKAAHDLGNYKGSLVEVKKLLCPHCPKMFPYSSKLQRHILTHTGEKPFKCSECSKGFRDNTDLKSHLKNTHQIVEDIVM